jgi:DNA polymerase-1
LEIVSYLLGQKVDMGSEGKNKALNGSRLILIDGYGLIFRAYHAVPPGLATSKGELTNATFGFTSMLLEVLRRETPDYIVMAFDTGRTFRHDDYEQYKANRSEMQNDLVVQIPRIREIVEALGIAIYESEGFEADDVIGTLARQGTEQGLDVLIITGDNDLLQLVNEQTRAALPGAGPKARFSDVRYFDVDAVKARYEFGPEFIPDYKAITGDKSDNIPGIPGLGDVTAKKLINQYGTIEKMLAHINEIKPPKVQTALETNREQALKSKRLATIVTDVPVKLDLEASRAHQLDRERVTNIFREVEFRNLLSRIPSGPTEAPAKPAAPQKKQAQLSLWEKPETEVETPPTLNQTASPQGLVRDSVALQTLVARIKQTGEFAFDTETTSEDPMKALLVGVSISPSIGESYYIPVGHVRSTGAAVFERLPGQLEIKEVIETLTPLFHDPDIKKIAHHAKYDLAVLQRHGVSLRGLGIDFDTMIAAQLAGYTSSRLKDLAFDLLGAEMTRIEELIGTGRNQITMDKVAIEDAARYAAADAEYTLRLVEIMQNELERSNQTKVFKEIEMPLIPVLTAMELSGVALDKGRLGQLSTLLYQNISQLEKQIFAEVGHEFNINSPDQLGQVLFGELGLQGGKKTSTRKFSTDKKTLDSLRMAHPIVEQVLEYRQVGKLKSTYVDSLPLLINRETGRVHTSYQQIGASSGRMSSNNPNLQNIPIRTEIGREVRKAFIADNSSDKRFFGDEKCVLLSADYSQIELRLLAHLTDDERLTTAFLADKDIHRTTAADVFGVPEDKITDDMRRVAKTVNFGIIYGLSAFGLTQQINIGFQEAAAFIERYKANFPSVWHYLESTPEEARKTGFVQTLLGRRRYMPELTASNPVLRKEAERAAINMPVQGTAADIVKIAMRRVFEAIQAEHLRGKMLLQVHDELVFETPENELQQLGKLVKTQMESVAEVISLKVPLKVDLKTGLNWGEMEHKVI